MKQDSLKQYVTLHQSLLAEKSQLETRLQAINKALNGSVKLSAPKPAKRTMSAAGRAKVSAAQKARWAKIHAAKKK